MALILVAIGFLLLLGNLRPEFHVWHAVATYWPLILILLGLGRLWDYSHRDRYTDARSRMSGGVVVLLIVLLVIGVALSRNHRGAPANVLHKSDSVDLQGAELVRATIEMPTGALEVSGGASKLLEAQFDYAESEGEPQTEYRVFGKQGDLKIRQIHAGSSHVHMLGRPNTWNLRMNDDVPVELSVHMGAGQGDLRLQGLSLTRLEVHVGAGELALDLRGDWKKNLDAEIHGGVGSATIRLPRNVGVRISASGGIGSINAGGLRRDGDEYFNEAYGKSPVTIRMDFRGGIGEINLRPES